LPRHLVVFVAALTSVAASLSSALLPIIWVAASSFALSSIVSVIVGRLHSVVVVCIVIYVNACVVVCVAHRLLRCQLHRSKHSGDRRCMLGMDIAMDRANLVHKDIKYNARDRGYYCEMGALRQQMT
jgi:hypothetical protein